MSHPSTDLCLVIRGSDGDGPAVWVGMKLEQGQVWMRESDYLRIVKWERLAIEYKQIEDLDLGEGSHHRVTKKEFCKLIKGATLCDDSGYVDPGEAPELPVGE